MTREIIAAYGVRNDRRCLVIRDGKKWIVERYVEGKPRRKRFATRADAKRWAEAWHANRPGTASSLTVRQLWRKYLDIVPEQKEWRGSTLKNALANWKRLEEVIGPDTLVDGLTLAHMDDLWKRLTEEGYAANQIRSRVKLLQRVIAWAHSRDHTPNLKPCLWSVPKVQQLDIPEYTADECGRLIRSVDYRDGWEWRPWACMMILAAHGFRINALLHLKWADVDLEAGTIILRAAYDKTKREWSRPLTWDSYAALLTARWHAERLGKASPWVFYGLEGRPWTYGAWDAALRKAEKRAGVQHIDYRGAHSFRRMVVGDVSAANDPAVALRYIGDRDLRQAAKYRKERDAETEAVADSREVRA